MNTVALERPPDPTPPVPNGAPPQPVSQQDRGWIVIGPRLREHLGPHLERAMPLVWVALLEMSGVPDGAPYRVVVDGCHLEPLPPGAVPG